MQNNIQGSERVLITGINSFTGRYLSKDLLAKGYQVFGTHNTVQTHANTYQMDLLNPSQILLAINTVQPDYIVHLAGKSFAAANDISSVYLSNIIGTRNLLEAIVQTSLNLKKIIIASTGAVYGSSTKSIINENTVKIPSNDYAISKSAVEEVANLFKDRIPILVTRPFNYTGVGQDVKFLIPKIVDHFKNRLPTIELGNLDIWRDFSDVRSVSSAYSMLIGADISDCVINICSGSETSLREIVNFCSDHTNHPIDIHVNSDFVRKGDPKHLRGDNTLLNMTIPNWKPRPFKETLKWMLA